MGFLKEVIKMDKLNYRKNIITENDEQVRVSTGDDDRYIYIRVRDNDEENAIVALTRKEAQRVKRYLEDAITTNIMNWEEE